MLLVIDAYNVLKKITKSDFATSDQIHKFRLKIARYAKSKGHQVILVFDRGPYNHVTSKKNKFLTEVFTGNFKTADDYIMEFIKKRNHAHDFVLVSSDLELCVFASESDIVSLDAEAFIIILNRELRDSQRSQSPGGVFHKMNGGRSATEIDELIMEGSSLVGSKDKLDDELDNPSAGSGRKASKTERHLLKLLKDCDAMEMNDKVIRYSINEIDKAVQILYSLLDKCSVFAFEGDLGAGKTTLIKELLSKCGVMDVVSSPTFAYVSEYSNKEGQVFRHFDLHRVKSLDEFFHFGFNELLNHPNSWSFIEWPEVVLPILIKNVCFVSLKYKGRDEREMVLKI